MVGARRGDSVPPRMMGAQGAIDPAIDPENVAQIVFGTLAQWLPAAEVEEVRAMTPKPLRTLWPI